MENVELYKEKNGQLSFVPVPEERARYIYHGPIFLFDKCIAHMKFATWANSPGKAYANILFQAKKELGYDPSTKIAISKNLIKKEELKHGRSI